MTGRIAEVDALRGFALFGILVVNIQAFASTFYGSGIVDPAFAGPLDRMVRLLVAVVFETKFYLLFSFLFGYSFTLQMEAADRAGEALPGRILRRQAGLLLIGLMHAVLLFTGDILTIYGVLGVLLLALRRLSDRTVSWLAGVLVLATGGAWLVLGLLLASVGAGTDGQQAAGAALAMRDSYRGDAAAIVARHLADLPDVWIALVLFQAPCAMAMFLLGLMAGRRQLLRRIGEVDAALRRISVVGLLVGLPGAVLYAAGGAVRGGSGWELAAFGIGLLTAPFLTAAYGAAVLLVFRRPGGERLVRWLAPAGRIALSNYLLQSVVCALLFTGYGAALVGRVSPAGALGMAAAIFLLQTVLSRWWLRRHVYGPMEWLLRALTIWRVPSWRFS
ncbi:DUF418 domain-containing protein [Azospirillum thermophilum]|uniref:DUF418 domain-containing protein n=1 Tax=Azospirillum thermophilum TaxID=2202148 RepID=A0A2S2CQP8_9PROT|nr:DUF418 domain-containing protein [Azospirillum thermophilum]AWK86627.1 DUF418 domain-containing protein [Azospirillum thermophilum]